MRRRLRRPPFLTGEVNPHRVREIERRAKGASPTFFDVNPVPLLPMLIEIVRNARRLVKDDRGADLVEYGLIGAAIAIAGILFFPTIFAKLDQAFETWGTNVYDAWEPEAPVEP